MDGRDRTRAVSRGRTSLSHGRRSRRVLRRARRLGSRGAIATIMPRMARWIRLARLADLKRKDDLDNVFHLNQNFRPA